MICHRVLLPTNTLCRPFRVYAVDGRSAQNTCRSKSLNERLWNSFLAVRSPVSAKTTYSVAVREFVAVAVLGYECGLTDTGFSDFLSTEITDLDASTCLELVCLVWITLIYSYKAINRWSAIDPVSERMFEKWKGFVKFMVIAYFEKGMAWVPIDRLQLEQTVMMGESEAPAIVAEKARIVFTTLETVAPQFPTL